MSLSDLPALNATLNGIATVLLVAGFVAIRRGRITVHRNLMLAAFGTSVLFLASYLTYHFNSPVTRFTAEGWPQWVYYPLLASHVVLAAAVPPLAIITLYRGLRMRVARHRAIARWTLPIWLYVSVTGVLVYLMLYQWFPPGA